MSTGFLRSCPSVVASENWATRKGWKWDGSEASESGSGDCVCCGDAIPMGLSAVRPGPGRAMPNSVSFCSVE